VKSIQKRQYTDYEIQKITQQPYISSTILSKELKIPASTIRRFRNENGIYTKFKIPIEEKDNFINNYLKLQSSEEMAKLYNVDHHTIEDYCKRIGFDSSEFKKQKLTEDQIQYIVDNYNNYSSTKISKRLNISSEAVTGVWHRFGLTGKDNRTYYLLNENYFEKIDSHNKAYYLGFIGADGCCYKPSDKYNKQNIIRINIHKKDIDILKKLQNELQTNKPLYYSDSNMVALEISSNKIFSDLENLGLSTRKTYDNTIADINEDFMESLVRGYFDGDGSIDQSRYRISIVGFKNNIDKIAEYLNKHNIFTTIVLDKRKYNSNNFDEPFCNMIISNKTSIYSFLKLIYRNKGDIYLKRKYIIAKEFIDKIENSKKNRDKQIVQYYNYAV
jgi:transposase